MVSSLYSNASLYNYEIRRKGFKPYFRWLAPYTKGIAKLKAVINDAVLNLVLDGWLLIQQMRGEDTWYSVTVLNLILDGRLLIPYFLILFELEMF